MSIVMRTGIVLFVPLAAALIAACSSVGGDIHRSAITPELDAGELPSVVKTRMTYQGPVFVNRDGMTLYTSRTGKPGRSE
jgi:predicted lipoprotein with Yx(FWY)xxD motif